jgi:uncharacterized protein YkwD
MKTLFRILIVVTCLGIVYYYSNVEPSKTELLEGPAQITQPVSEVQTSPGNVNDLPRPTSGISKFIGISSNVILENYGRPNRVDPSSFGYEWWIYQTHYELLMVGILEGVVSQIYTNSMNYDVSPYIIGQSLDDVYRRTIFEQEATAEVEGNIYAFAMNEQDMKNRILVKYDELFAQLYIDSETSQLDGVRFIDGTTLVLHKPYEMQFVGELLEASTPSSFVQMEINRANGLQLTDLANSFRKKNDRFVLMPSTKLVVIADDQSEAMFLENMDTQIVETEVPNLEDRLKEQQSEYHFVNENIATNYIDAIEVMYGWMNSKEHRELLLNDQLTHIGSGAFVNYYTQIYLSEKE